MMSTHAATADRAAAVGPAERENAVGAARAEDQVRAADAAPSRSAVVKSGEREHFIPVSRFALMQRLTEERAWPNGEAESVRRFFRVLAHWRHLSYTERLLRLKEAYLPFSPDRDTVRANSYSPEECADKRRRLVELLRCLLERANYKRITKEMLDDIFSEDSAYGLDLEVDLTEFEEAMLYYRGAATKTLRKRDWKKLYLGWKESEVPVFQRLFLLLKLKPAEVRIKEIMQREGCNEKKAAKLLKRYRRMLPDDVSSDYIYLKLFKRIPRADIQMLFPNTKVQFRPFDKIKLALTAGGGTLASVATTATKILAAANPLKAAVALLGLVGVVFRQVMKFFNQRNQYMMVLAQNLYFHNLADNRGVLTLLSDRGEEEDIKEEMLLYALLAKEPLLEEELPEGGRAIERYLEEEFGVQVAFDLYDALSRLEAEGLIRKDAEGRLSMMPPAEASRYIDSKWDEYLNTDDLCGPTEKLDGASATP